MCLSTAYKTSEPDSIIMEYVSKIEVEGNLITLTDVIGDTKTVEGTIKMVDLTGGVVKSTVKRWIDNNCLAFPAGCAR